MALRCSGSHHQHVAPVAVGDHLLLQVLRGVALRAGTTPAWSAAGPLLAEPLADAGKGRAGVVGHFARRLDLAPHVGDLVAERRHALHQPHQIGECGAGLGDRLARLLDRLEEIGEAQQAQRLQRTALGAQPFERGLQFGGRTQREPRVDQQEARRLRTWRRAPPTTRVALVIGRQRLDLRAGPSASRQVGHERRRCDRTRGRAACRVHVQSSARRAWPLRALVSARA